MSDEPKKNPTYSGSGVAEVPPGSSWKSGHYHEMIPLTTWATRCDDLAAQGWRVISSVPVGVMQQEGAVIDPSGKQKAVMVCLTFFRREPPPLLPSFLKN